MDRPLTTADVPPRFLQAAFLVGHVPQRALASDPRVSYALYVPPTEYPTTSSSKKLALLVYVHGTRRNISAIHSLAGPVGDSTPCAILAPLFPSNLDGPNDLGSYKLLAGSKTLRADLALLSILDEVAYCWPGIETTKIFLMGFSGGGQFTHRFLYLYPERLAAVSVGAPGQVTMLDERDNWPRGIANVSELFGGRVVRRDLIRQVRIQLVVGEADVGVHGGQEFSDWVREMKHGKKDESRAQGRLDMLKSLWMMWEHEDGILAQFHVVPAVGHSAHGVQKDVLEFLRPLMKGESLLSLDG